MGWLNANGIWIGRNRGGGLGSSYWKTRSEFFMGQFDFTTNQLKDISGNGNHATLKNASARIAPVTSDPLITTLSDGLTHYYSFNEQSGDLIDMIGSNDGTVNGTGVQGAIGKMGFSYFFSSNAKYVDLADNITFPAASSFSIVILCKPTNLGATGSHLFDGITVNNSRLNLYRVNDDLIGWVRDNNAHEINFSFADCFVLNEWCLIALVKNVATDKLQLIVNNVAGAEYDDPMTSDIVVRPRFGLRNTSLLNWQGYIDTIMMYDKALTTDELTALYNTANFNEYPFDGVGLYYSIPGLLTSDMVTAETGSGTPTIPIDGVLRLPPGEKTYGVTIKRAGVVWSILPFCESKCCTENIPYTSYDVSGNGNHATSILLVDANITTQDDYFYLQQHGYNIGGSDLIASVWDFDSWSGEYPNQVWDGLDSIGGGIVEPVEGGLVRITTPNQIRETVLNVVGRRYITEITVTDKTVIAGLAEQCAFKITNNGLINTVIGNPNTFKAIDRNGYRRSDFVATSAIFEINGCGYAGTAYSYIITQLTHREKLIIPALLSGINDALGRALEFIPDGYKWFQYGCELEFPDDAELKVADQKGYWSDLITGGYLINGETYLIETTEEDFFGAGKVVHDEFVSDGSEYATRNNTVRQLITFSGNRGLLYDDGTGAAIPLKFDDVRAKRTHFMYCKKNFHEDANFFQYDYGYIENLTVLKSSVFVTDIEKLRLITDFNLQQETDTTYVVFSYDASENTASMDRIRTLFNDRKINFTQMINYGDTLSKADVQTLIADGNEIGLHTGKTWEGAFLTGYKDFHEIDDNYTAEELAIYWGVCKAYYLTELGITLKNHAYPGGGADSMSVAILGNHFRSGRGASGSGYYNKLPIRSYGESSQSYYEFLHSSSLDTIETTLADYQAYIDEYITYKNFGNFYGHYTAGNWSEDDWTAFEALLDYIIAKQAAGDLIRIAVVDDALDIIENKK